MIHEGEPIVPEEFAAASDCEKWDREIAHRNVLFGLWAGSRLGLSGDDLETYAWSVHFADGEEPGHDDVIAKVSGDLAAHGIVIKERLLRQQLREMQLRAFFDLANASTRAPAMRGRAAAPRCNA